MKAWKTLAKIRTKTAEARETLDAKLTRAGEGARDFVEQAGGLGQATKEVLKIGGEYAGLGVNKAKRAVEAIRTAEDGDKFSDAYARTDKGDDITYMSRGRQIASNIITGVERAVEEASTVTKKGIRNFKEKTDEYMLAPEEHIVTIGTTERKYTIGNVETRTELSEVRDYLQEASKRIPSRSKHRDTILHIIAGEGIRSYEQLQAIAPQFGIEGTNEYQRLQ